jgi:diaminopimelate epimerase
MTSPSTSAARVADGAREAQVVRFTKGHGTENDFVMVLDPDGEWELEPGTVRFLCDRRAGIGADGVIRAVRAGRIDAGAGFAADTWFMDYWNSDGTVSEMCGNGARVFAAFLEREVGEDFSRATVIGTRGGERTLTALGDGRYAVGMGPWAIPYAHDGADSRVKVAGITPRPGLSVDVGNPHTVVALGTLDELAALDLSHSPRVEPEPEHGSNVEFVVPLGETTVDGERRGVVRMRVHERGSGETRSCGTGAVAVALAVRAWGGDAAPWVWEVQVPGGAVVVRVSPDDAILEGPAALVARGEVSLP